MDYKEIWKDICFHVEKSRKRNDTEELFQRTVELLFEKLGWSMRRGEIHPNKAFPDGAAKRIVPDIIIADDGKYVFVVEVKRADATPSERSIGQLISYMSRLRLDFGILIAKPLQVYYQQPTKNEPDKVCEIQFDYDSEIGLECIEVLSKKDFFLDRFEAFCKKCFADPEKYLYKPKRAINAHKASVLPGINKNYGRNRGELTHIIMPGPKAKVVGELRGSGHVVCWEQTYDEYYDVRNNGNVPPRMPRLVLEYIKSMTDDQLDVFTKFMVIVFYRGDSSTGNVERKGTSRNVSVAGFEEKHRPKVLLDEIPSDFYQTGEIRDIIWWNGFEARRELWSRVGSDKKFVIGGKHKFEFFIIINETEDGRLMADAYYFE